MEENPPSYKPNTDYNSTYKKEKKIFKIIVVGDSNVGKTCLTYRFCEGKYLEKPEATIGVDFRERVVNISGEDVKLQLWDTAGQERFRKTMVHHYYRNANAIVIVYDVTKMSTFQSVPMWLEECEQHLTGQIPRILVGNKCDCPAADDKVVNTSLAQRVADSHNMPLFETSALSESEGSNIEAIFLTLAHKLIRQRPMMSPTMSSLSSNDNLHRANVISIARTTAEPTSSSCGC